MSATPFVDTNIFLRHLRQDHSEFSPRATEFLRRVERQELKVRTADTVIFETVFTLQSLYKQPKAAIRVRSSRCVDCSPWYCPSEEGQITACL